MTDQKLTAIKNSYAHENYLAHTGGLVRAQENFSQSSPHIVLTTVRPRALRLATTLDTICRLQRCELFRHLLPAGTLLWLDPPRPKLLLQLA